MEDKIIRKLFLGFIQIHILYHADKEPLYGTYMIEELENHGYKISPGTLYPILHEMHKNHLLLMEEILVGGKIRKYYTITLKGRKLLDEAKDKALELVKEITS